MASWSESSSRAGGGKGNRWEVGGSKDLGGVSFTKEGCCRENELGLQALEGRERPWGGLGEEEAEVGSENPSLDQSSQRSREEAVAKGGGWQGCKILRGTCPFSQGQMGLCDGRHRGLRRGRNGSWGSGIRGQGRHVDGQKQSQRSQGSAGMNEPLRVNAVGFRLRVPAGRRGGSDPWSRLAHGPGAAQRCRGPAQADPEVRALRVRRVPVAPGVRRAGVCSSVHCP